MSSKTHTTYTPFHNCPFTQRIEEGREVVDQEGHVFCCTGLDGIHVNGMLIVILSRILAPREIPLLIHQSRAMVPVIKSNDNKIFLPLFSTRFRAITFIENKFSSIDKVFDLCASEAAVQQEERVDGVCGGRARSGVRVDIDGEATD
jgi:hypothetical protein